MSEYQVTWRWCNNQLTQRTQSVWASSRNEAVQCFMSTLYGVGVKGFEVLDCVRVLPPQSRKLTFKEEVHNLIEWLKGVKK